MNFTRKNMLLTALIVGALIIEVAVLMWFFDQRADDDPVSSRGVESRFDETAACGGTAPSGETSNVRFDDAKRFAVTVPPKWNGRAEGSVVTLNKKNGRATLSVGRARSGDLLQALTDLRASLRRSYRELDVTSLELFLLDGCPARSVAGRARNRMGRRLDFEGVVVSGPTDNFVIAGFFERGSEPRLDEELKRVIRSVRFYLTRAEERRARS